MGPNTRLSPNNFKGMAVFIEKTNECHLATPQLGGFGKREFSDHRTSFECGHIARTVQERCEFMPKERPRKTREQMHHFTPKVWVGVPTLFAGQMQLVAP